MLAYSGPGFLSLGVDDIRGLIILWYGGHPVHCRMFRSIPGLYSLDTSSFHHLCSKNVSRKWQVSTGGQNHPRWEPRLLRSFGSPFPPSSPAACLIMCKLFLKIFPFPQQLSCYYHVSQLSNVHLPFPSLLEELQDLICATNIARPSSAFLGWINLSGFVMLKLLWPTSVSKNNEKMPSDLPNQQVLFDRFNSIK